MENNCDFEEKAFIALNLSGETYEDYRFIDCTFIDCTFDNCSLYGCHFVDCKFENCRISTIKASLTQMYNAEFTNCYLSSINWNGLLPLDGFSGPISKLQSCVLKYNTFSRMHFVRFDFSTCNLVESMFSECHLSDSNFKGCTLDNTEFFKCELARADFRDALGYQIDIKTSTIKGAKFSFPEVVNLLNGLEIKID